MTPIHTLPELFRSPQHAGRDLTTCKKFTRNMMRTGLGTITLLMISVSMVCAAPASGQPIDRVNINIRLEHETLTQAFKKIEALSHYHFMYRSKEVSSVQDLTVPAGERSIASFLNLILTNTALHYRQVDWQILISREVDSGALPVVAAEEAGVGAGIVKGRVTNEKGEPLAGVSVSVKGNSKGTTTDETGKFEISAGEESTLVFSYVDFSVQEIAGKDRSDWNIVMHPTEKALNEVIVTALGITRSVKSLTYAAQTVKGSQVNEARETNFINGLQGKVAGVTITKDATGPGGESKVLIRGNRSITNSNQPLYVIDGVPLSGGIEMLNSDDVETMTILKGASAAALYGSQGQNGAIIITTKKAKGEPVVNYTGSFTLDQAAVLPKLQYLYGQGDEGTYGMNSENSWGPKAEGQTVELWNGHSVPLKGQPDRLKNYFRTAHTLTNTISLSGGDEKTQTYFAYGNTAAQGIMRNNDLLRHNVDFKIDRAVTSRLSFSAKVSYIYENVDNRLVPGGSGSYALPSLFLAPVTIPESDMKHYAYTDANGDERQDYWKVNSSVMSNPYWALHRVLYFQKKDRILGLVTAKYKFTDWLDLQLRGSIDKTFQNNNQKTYADNYWSQVGSDYSYSSRTQQGVNVDALLSFHHALNKDFTLSGNVGAALQETRYEYETGDATGLNKPNFFFMSNAVAPYITNGYGRTPRVQSVYGTATLKFREYLYLDVTVRNDWSSALPKANRSFLYPSAGITAIVSDMVKLPSWITYGKVRFTSASSGYGGTEYLDRNYYSVGTGGAIITPSIQSLGNYKPELTHSLEAGLDWRFFNDRFGFDLTLYDTRTKNQLLLIGLPPASLFEKKYINAGLIQNKGIEISADITPVRTKSFSWTAAVNFSKNINKVKRLTDDMKSVVISAGDNVYLIEVNEGSSYGDMYVRGWQKNDQGQRLVEDDGTPILTDGLNTKVGNYNPDYMLGFSNRFSYKSFALSFLIDYRQGGVVISGTQALIDAYGDSKASLRGRETGIVLDAVTADGKKNTAAVSAQKYFSLIGGRYPIGEFYSYSATNTRLREVVFSYRIASAALAKTHFIKAATISAVGRNLFFFQRSAPVDPEVTQGVDGGGLEYAALPSTRNYGINLKLTF